MSRIIIGIHGLGRKPPAEVVSDWWKRAICEGLKHINHPGVFFRFELVYWADVLHPRPLDPTVTDNKSQLYVEYPYVPATDFAGKPPSKLRRKVLDFLEKKLDKIFLKPDRSPVFTSVSDLIIRHYFQDLDSYYSQKVKNAAGEGVPVKDVIRDRLTKVLRRHRKNEILLIAHSMGSLIAYEVLSLLDQEVQIDTLVTIGSPLGQPLVTGKFLSEFYPHNRQNSKPTTPENIRRKWYNLTDLEDNVAMNYDLADDFEPNSRQITATDKVVYNNYVHQKKRNPHKSYGYLRTPATAEIIYNFLSRDRSRFGFWLSNRWLEFTEKFRGK